MLYYLNFPFPSEDSIEYVMTYYINEAYVLFILIVVLLLIIFLRPFRGVIFHFKKNKYIANRLTLTFIIYVFVDIFYAAIYRLISFNGQLNFK